jgi:hypothetical protein
MLFSILLLLVIIYFSWRISPRERQEDAHVHGAGQVGLLAAIALFGVDYFTSYFYATGEMLHALHPYGLEHLAYYAVVVIAIANIVFGALYMYFLGVFREGGGSFAAAMRYLGPGISLIEAVILLQDYILTIVVSTLSGVDQLLSLWSAGGIAWYWHFLLGAGMVCITWFITIRGRGESARVVFMALGIFVLLTITMAIGLMIAQQNGVAPLHAEKVGHASTIWEALFHLLGASMKGLVALTGLEAMADGIQFLIDEDPAFVKWGKKKLPMLKGLWNFFSGKAGIGRTVQTSFLFYGAVTTLMLTYFAIHFQAFDGVDGRSLVGNLAFIGFHALSAQGGVILFWAYQILAVGLLTAASMTAFQDLQAITWRNVAIGEIPEVVVYRNPKGTFTRPVAAAAITAIVVQFLVRGNTSAAVPFYGVGVFVPITIMGLAMRQHIKQSTNITERARKVGIIGTNFSIALSSFIFLGQIFSKWTEGGWAVLATISILVLLAYIMLLSPAGYRDPEDIHRIIREKSRIQGQMGNMVEWQSLRIQEYRYAVMLSVAKFFGLFGVFKPLRFDDQAVPPKAGEFEAALSQDEHQTFLEQYLENQPKPEPKLGGAPKESTPGEDEH